MADEAQAFIDQSRGYLLAEYLPKIERCVEALSEDDLWWRPNPFSNSIGNLLMHLAGNVRQWIISGVGGADDVRHRQQEFDAQEGASADTLVAQLRATLEEADQVLAALRPAALLEPLNIQGFDVTIGAAVYHVVEHFSTHVGQIIYITKMRTGHDLRFYEMTADGRIRRGWLGGPKDGA